MRKLYTSMLLLTVLTLQAQGQQQEETLSYSKASVLKTGVFAPLSNYVTLTYERLVKPGNSLEMTLGYIGVGMPGGLWTYQGDREVHGGLIRCGWKIIIPTRLSKDVTDHPLHGFYFRPDILIGFYKQEVNYYSYFIDEDVHQEDKVFYTTFLISMGKQWVINRFCIDAYAGGGYNITNQAYDPAYFASDFDIGSGTELCLAATAGLRLGLVLK